LFRTAKKNFLIFFRENITSNTVFKKDGHRSYPYAVAEINGIHKIVNHERLKKIRWRPQKFN
jgi:hypothetical protein